MRTRDNTVYGVGINDFNNNVSVNGHYIKSYYHWKSMLQRCYDKKSHKARPTYIGCSVCNEWLSFSVFKEWFDKNYVEDYHLDKDILFKGNNIYSPETCCFVPQRINSLFVKRDASRGKYPIGVYYDNIRKNFKSFVKYCSKTKYIGSFDSQYEAYLSYKYYKEAYIKKMAVDYYELGLISKIVYNAMLNYKVNIND